MCTPRLPVICQIDPVWLERSRDRIKRESSSVLASFQTRSRGVASFEIASVLISLEPRIVGRDANRFRRVFELVSDQELLILEVIGPEALTLLR
jgi:hypothetical protein